MTSLDRFVPRWQFRERHSIRVAASPEAIFKAILRVTPREILFFRTLTFIRHPVRGTGESILNAPPDEPLLDVATRTGFRYLANEPPHEIVIGVDISPEVFAAMNFLIDGSLLSTETRVFASTAKARRIFAVYWFAIRLGSGFIRRMWLRAIRRRAEL
jgi:hypothetical protein